ncbi:MAG TPA: TIGR00730 family Rossman fold protein [Blastocatellia bacterium]|nr:TIGR00730 family Rossman fold protein [Blastocatellia bacterium]
MTRTIKRVCIYCASSQQIDSEYLNGAWQLGRELAEQNVTIVYGGGSTGMMGAVANGALSVGGTVIGILPHFMNDLEWGHQGLTELRLVDDMHERKRLMAESADAIIALPGGCGTFEELFEAITWKRLGLYFNPIILVNIRGFFDPCIELLTRCINERFMDERHGLMWTVVERPEQVVQAIQKAPEWDASARSFAALR